jgi:hypothetical protein
MTIRNPKDLAAGLMFMAFGIASIVAGFDYSLGTAAQMGPGYFPRILGGLLIALGAAIAFRALTLAGTPVGFGSPAPAAIVLAAVVLFGAAVSHLGAFLSSLIVVVISSTASREFRLKEASISGAILAIAAVAVFIYGLGLQLPAWPPAFGSR